MTAAPTAGAPHGATSQQVGRAGSVPSHQPPAGEPRRWSGATGGNPPGSSWIVVALWALLALPLAVAFAVLRTKHWVPIGDIALTELKVRDVWSRHPPLIGLAGRIGPFYRQGSHPGPLSFWALWPVYRLFGATPMALVASGTLLQLIGAGGALWLSFRRGGLRLAIGVAVILALLTRSYGAVTLTEPWNPFLPVMWWFLFLIAVWSVLCDDLVAFPVAVFAGSFCMETHISYLGLVGGMSVVLLAGLALAGHRRRGDAVGRRQLLRWGLGGIVLGLVLWAPPVIEQLTTSPGNATVIYRHFTHPPEAAAGLSKGVELLLVPLNPWWWIRGHQAVLGSTVPGLAMLAVLAFTAVLSWRWRHPALIRLHLVVAVGLALGLISAAKIFGPVYSYLLLWAWGVGALLFVAAGWTAAVALGRRLQGERRDRTRLATTAALAALTVLVAGAFTVSASSTKFRAQQQSTILRLVVGPTAAALSSDGIPGGGRSGLYLVTWTDPISIGTQGFGLLSELERRGFHVGAEEVHGPGVTTHRVLEPGQYTGVVHFSVGNDIAVWRAKRRVRQVAYVDLRSPAERARYARLRLQVIAGLKAARMEDQIPAVDGQLYGAALNPKVPKPTFRRMVQMLDLGLPTAVFVGPPSSMP